MPVINSKNKPGPICYSARRAIVKNCTVFFDGLQNHLLTGMRHVRNLFIPALLNKRVCLF
jgi:hypothetical protein